MRHGDDLLHLCQSRLISLPYGRVWAILDLGVDLDRRIHVGSDIAKIQSGLDTPKRIGCVGVHLSDTGNLPENRTRPPFVAPPLFDVPHTPARTAMRYCVPTR